MTLPVSIALAAAPVLGADTTRTAADAAAAYNDSSFVAQQVEHEMTHQSGLIPSHDIAAWILDLIRAVLDFFGLGHNNGVEEVLYVIVVAAFAILLGIGLRIVILWAARKFVKLHDNHMGRELLREHTLSKCMHIIPPLVIMALLPFAFNGHIHALVVLMRLMWVYTLITLGIGICAVMTFVFGRYNERMNTRNLPLQGILNIGKGAVWCIIAILCIAILIDKSPMALLAGLGAFAAALMLIFKDSILGFVAGIQMSQNDMLHVGDWIVVPTTPANGTVIDVSLTAVKVRNWDNTIVTVPPYKLVQGSFQNWKGMSDSGMRRILQTFVIDYGHVTSCTPELIAAVVKKYPSMAKYVDAMKAGGEGAKGWLVGTGTRPVNGTIETNVGLFRAYVCEYLLNNPHISTEGRVLVQLTEASTTGLGMQIWCFTNTTDFNAYESIQSAIMEHITNVMPDFGLLIYNDGSESVTITNSAGQSIPLGGPAQ